MKKALPFLFLPMAALSFLSCQKERNDFDLAGTQWRVEKIKEEGDSNFRWTFKKYIFDFQSDSNFVFNLDINGCGARYHLVDMEGKIFISPPICTMICCDTKFAEDMALLVPKMTTYYRKRNKLILEGRGEIVLTRHY